jgi:hypothetical protein
VVENSTKTEGDDAMTDIAIDIGYWMAHYLRPSRVRPAGITVMTGIAAIICNQGTAVVGVSAQKTVGRMTVDAFRVSLRVATGRGVIGGGRLADAHSAVVAHAATTRNTRMIKTAIQRQLQKMAGIMAAIAFDDRRQVKFGLADGQYTVMAATATSKNFEVVHTGDNGKTKGCMTALAHITGTEVIRRLLRDRTELGVMTIHAI